MGLLSLSKHTLKYRSTPSIAIAFLRFLSSKKPDKGQRDQTSSTKLPISETKVMPTAELKEGSKTVTKQHKSKIAPHKDSKYLSFDEFPRAPQSVIDKAKQYNRRTPRNIFLKADDDLEFIPYKYEFFRLRDHIQKSKFPATDFWKRLNDYVIVHPMKRSITARVFEVDPNFNDVSDDLLESLCPDGKIFGNAPFGGDASFNCVQNYENKINEARKAELAIREAYAKDLEKKRRYILQTDTFYTKRSNSIADNGEKGGRRKLDRFLLKCYKSLNRRDDEKE